VLGGGLRLNPGGAFLGAATGTPVIICGFTRLCERAHKQERVKECPDLNGYFEPTRPTSSEVLWNSLLVQSHGKGMVQGKSDRFAPSPALRLKNLRVSA